MLHAVADQPECWPRLSLDSWKDTYGTVHMWTQMVGKVRLRLAPLVNHWWNVPLYVTARGLTTSRIPYGQRAFELWFDFIRHQLVIETTDGILKTLPLVPRSVAEFYGGYGRNWRATLRTRHTFSQYTPWAISLCLNHCVAFDKGHRKIYEYVSGRY